MLKKEFERGSRFGVKIESFCSFVLMEFCGLGVLRRKNDSNLMKDFVDINRVVWVKPGS
jgi:hypothetical protein